MSSDIVQQTKPFLWGPVKSALIQDAKEHGPDTILKLCYEDDQRVKEMMVAVLTDWGRDDLDFAHQLARELLPLQEEQPTLKRAWRLLRPTVAAPDRAAANARQIAVGVAGNLGFKDLLEDAAFHSDTSTRVNAVKQTYYLWGSSPEAAFAILDYISKNVMHGPVPDIGGFESLLGLSLTLFLKHTQEPRVLRHLQAAWQRVMDSVFGISSKSSSVGRLARGFVRERAFSLAIDCMFRALRELPGSNTINYPDIQASFDRRRKDPARYREWIDLYLRLLRYIDVTGDYSREQLWQDMKAALHARDMLVESAFGLCLCAHLVHSPTQSLPYVKELLKRAEEDEVPSPYIDDITFGSFFATQHHPRHDDLYEFFLHCIPIYRAYYAEHTEIPGLHRERSGFTSALLGPRAMFDYLRTGSVYTPWLQKQFADAVERNDSEFFLLVTEWELAFIGIEYHTPLAALEVIAMLLTLRGTLATSTRHRDKKMAAAIEPMIVNILVKLRAVYPDMVDDFIEEHQLSDEWAMRVSSTEPKETIGTLIGMGAWNFLLDDVILGSPPLRARLVSALAAAAEFGAAKGWLDHILREIINVIYGHEILPSKRITQRIKQ
jgi:hypothetical protein